MHSPEPSHQHQEPFYAPGPLHRHAMISRLSSCSSNISSVSQQDFGSPKRLQESTSNPPRDFLKICNELRKMASGSKCKLEPATTPHEVLGFRDFSSEELLAHNLNSNSHYYRDTGNVSNWVQSTMELVPTATMNEYALYENVHTTSNSPSNILLEPQFPHLNNTAVAAAVVNGTNTAALAANQQRKNVLHHRHPNAVTQRI
ncbi:hypothetical protein EVAR_72990_1 [Eumeta japonica]|uniref:Uncharacterized protein n=1 Tax=Eumeta variegata TaxID=151549 RepID=A0A4C1SWE4_EUMVA|nr:hypothetical protein EVAR_72990_1 [Eumeta japonica]